MHAVHALEYAEITEAAAIAGFKHLGRGDKNLADGAAVEAMRDTMNTLQFSGRIVIGEGEIDEAPMLYIGEEVGKGGEEIDIAVDPIEGTRMTAWGQPNALAVMSIAEKGTLLHAPDMYMEKLVVGKELKGKIDLSKPLEENLRSAAQTLNKPLEDLTVTIIDKPRHEGIIRAILALGCRVFTFPDGDVSASLLTCLGVPDVMYGIGGAPEGVISAAAVRALGGDMQAKLLTRAEVKGYTEANTKASELETKRCHEMGLEVGQVLTLEKLASSDNVVFTATGVTDGDLLKGVKKTATGFSSNSLVIDGRSKKIQYLTSESI